MNAGLATGLVLGGVGLTLGVGAAVLDKPKAVKPIPQAPPGYHTPKGGFARDQKTASGIFNALVGATLLTSLLGTAMGLSMGKGHVIPPKVIYVVGGAVAGLGLATLGTGLVLKQTSKVS